MKRFITTLSLVAASSVLAHPGHGATPAHVHFPGHAGDAWIDVGSVLFVVVAAGVLLFGALAKAQKKIR